jgi:hypothetical protein
MFVSNIYVGHVMFLLFVSNIYCDSGRQRSQSSHDPRQFSADRGIWGAPAQPEQPRSEAVFGGSRDLGPPAQPEQPRSEAALKDVF